MDADLSRTVVVTISGTRPQVDLAVTAEVLHAELGIGQNDMSIRPFYPEDFLVICEHQIIWQLMVFRGHAPGHGFSLALLSWMRQAQATGVSLPSLVPLELVGVLAHAWTKRMVEVILRGLGSWFMWRSERRITSTCRDFSFGSRRWILAKFLVTGCCSFRSRRRAAAMASTGLTERERCYGTLLRSTD